MSNLFRTLGRIFAAVLLPLPAAAEPPLQLPTANTNIYAPGAEDHYYVGTVGRPWMSGTFGCVRTDGWQLHEGIDIRAEQRDKKGEPIDPVRAIADGVVLYVNGKAGLSNYGNYVILGHERDGVEYCSLYAHLREVGEGIRSGARIRKGDQLGVLGRTSNTRSGISKERAHLHLEVALFLNKRFPEWYAKRIPGARNDHGMFNGQNLAGFDPTELLRSQQRQGAPFNLVKFIQSQPELCRVQVRETDFGFLRRYRALVEKNPLAEQSPTAGYEIVFSHVGTPMKLIPRTAAELKSKARVHLLSVNEAVQREHRCRKLVTQKNGRWELATAGQNLVDLLVY
ncbi:MAG TPA: hypothetical protein DCY13_16400 [Verrucomicrobiales bacterium]|nr:hypothetical protein [Verrucomicrobiales bacterium]